MKLLHLSHYLWVPHGIKQTVVARFAMLQRMLLLCKLFNKISFCFIFSFSALFSIHVSPCRWIQSLPEALALWPVLECVHDCQVLVGWLVPPEAVRPAGVQHCCGPEQSPEDYQETVHPEQTLPQTTSHQSASREVGQAGIHWLKTK